MWNPAKDHNILKAVNSYAASNGLILPANLEYAPGIDVVFVRINSRSVLLVNLPPLADYLVEETEYTSRYLRTRQTATA